MTERSGWSGRGQGLSSIVEDQTIACLEVYRKDANRVTEDANTELASSEGAYGRRQLFELVQNGADALIDHPGRVEVVVGTDALYVANEGRAISEGGVRGLMAARLDNKRGDEIGRFGLGFKSVLAISNRPQIFSRSVSFGFDRDTSRATIHDIAPDARHYPVLRLATVLDPKEHFAGDPDLRALTDWATTVVRIPLDRFVDDQPRLVEDLRAFPAEFLLFSAHVRQLTLRSLDGEVDRLISLETAGNGRFRLREAGSSRSWYVATRTHRPSKAALKDAGELAGRQDVTLHWAAPLDARNSVGRFWAFFPTSFETTLGGVINAPFKLSEDRAGLLEGEFNRELISEVLPRLVTSALVHLIDDADPASVLDYLPARGRENRNWADEALNLPVFEALRHSPCLPDLDGALRRPDEVELHPRDISVAGIDAWSQLLVPALRPSWVHATVEAGDTRQAKAVRLLHDRERSSVGHWLEQLVSTNTVEASADAVRLAARLALEQPSLLEGIRDARIIRLEDGSLGRAVPGRLFVRSSPEEKGQAFVDPSLSEQAGVKDALASLGVTILDRSGELRHALSQHSSEINWGTVWQLARQLPVESSVSIFEDALPFPLESSVRVRTASGEWRPVARAFLGGEVVPSDGRRDRGLLIDPAFHARDTDLLTRLGAVANPTIRTRPVSEPWVEAFVAEMAEAYIKKRSDGKKIDPDSIQVDLGVLLWPLGPLSELSDEGRVALTSAALRMSESGAVFVTHGRDRVKIAPDPVTWRLCREGRVQTNIGPWPAMRVIAASDALASADALPIADVTSTVRDRLRMISGPEELKQADWDALLARAAAWSDDARRCSAYAWAARFSEPPSELVLLRGSLPVRVGPTAAAVTADTMDYASLRELQIPCLLAPDPSDVEFLINNWGLEDGAQFLKQEVVPQPVGEVVPLVDAFPPLKLWLEMESHDLGLQLCSGIDMIMSTPQGQRSRPLDTLLRDRIVFVTAEDPSGQLRQISTAVQLDMSGDDVRAVLDQLKHDKASKLKKALRKCASLEERLVLAVGVDNLREAVPEAAVQAAELDLGRGLTDVEIATMAHAVHGLEVLGRFSSALAARDLDPPVQWAGRSRARRFVTELGFAPEYAGFPDDQRPALEAVDGPAELDDLHDFQRYVTDRMRVLLRGEGKERGLVSLPTGAGKTRVAVQAVVEAVVAGEAEGPLLWIAQSDELCEQAVQTWSFVWRAIGPQSRLVISRFWGNNDAIEDPENVQLVVATIDKLANAVGKVEYEWMTDVSLVIVDEAHTSIAQSYTKVLDWLKRSGRSRSSDRRPLIGLTATAFRNTSEEETKRLVARYDNHRLDMGAFEGDAYEELQAASVLARVRQRVIDGAQISMTAQQRVEYETFNKLPKAVESALGENVERNRRIVDEVLTLPDDWSVLLFATTVENARSLAAQLSLKGVPSIAISANTDTAARHRYIDEFQAGRIRVLTNYNVLAQGFDAPAVKAVFVTRPTFSPNLYQQMIGRGLRGPKNGGSEEVLIVNVRDNIEQFGGQLAFTHFDHLWAN